MSSITNLDLNHQRMKTFSTQPFLSSFPSIEKKNFLASFSFSQIEKETCNFLTFHFSAALSITDLGVNHYRMKTFSTQLSPKWHHFLTNFQLSYFSFWCNVVYYRSWSINHCVMKTFSMQLSPKWHHFLTNRKRNFQLSYFSF